MIVKSVLLDKKYYKLVDETYCNVENAFTVIVGSNGTGKSRLLKRVINNIKNVNYSKKKIPTNYSKQIEFESNGKSLYYFSPVNETKSFIGADKSKAELASDDLKVIAVTTTPFDKFPIENKGLKEPFRYFDEKNYTYIGLKTSKNTLNQSNYLNLLARSILKNDQILKNEYLFNLLNLKSTCSVKFKTKFPISEHFIYKYTSTGYKPRVDWGLSTFKADLISYYSTLGEKILNTPELGLTFKAFIEVVKHLKEPISLKNNEVNKHALLYLLDIGLINVEDFIFHDFNSKSEINSSELSSGQKCMILTVLNIAGSIDDGAVVCIDEPEISLHPKWQKEYVNVLIKFFNTYKRCHFIIATHSPLIISELSSENCHILNMDDGTAYSSMKYRSTSSDLQLAEVFGVAGNNNEYLNRIVVSLLSKLSLENSLDDNEIKQLNSLINLSKQMNDDDHVKSLIDILSLAWSKVSSNAR